MSKTRWAVVDDALKSLRKQGAISPAYVGAVVERLEAALVADTKEPLETAQRELARLVRELLKSAPEDVRATVTGASESAALAAAFRLGQFGLAEHLAASSYAHRVDDRFLHRIKDKRYERYVRALIEKPLDGVQLRLRVDHSKEHVSRVLRVLRGLGIVDCRREGNRVVNFLTANARTAAEALNMSPLDDQTPRNERSAEVLSLLAKRREALPLQLRSVPTFGSQPDGNDRHVTRILAGS